MTFEVISVYEQPELAPEIFELNRINWAHLNEFRSGNNPPPSPRSSRQVLQHAVNHTPDEWGNYFDLKAMLSDNVVVGYVDVTYDENRPDIRTIGYAVDIEGGYGNRGFATTAIDNVVKALFLDDEIEMIDAYIHPDNEFSIRAIRKCGFVIQRAGSKKRLSRYVKIYNPDN